MLKKNLITKSMYGYSQRAPIHFEYEVKDKEIILKGFFGTHSIEYSKDEDPKKIIHRVSEYLFKNWYPKMQCFDSVYVISKINTAKNQILLKNLNAFNEKHIYAVKMRVPVIKFLDLYCREKSYIPTTKLWDDFCDHSMSISFGDDIYIKNSMGDI